MTSSTSGFTPSSKRNPCPICGRDQDGDCRIKPEVVLCHRGSSHAPPEGLKPGDTVQGRDGQVWAYTKESGDGRCATFVPNKPCLPGAPRGDRNGHRPRPPATPTQAQLEPQPATPQGLIQLVRLQGPAEDVVELNPDGPSTTVWDGGKKVPATAQATYPYAPCLRSTRCMPDGGDRKKFKVQHRGGGQWRNGAGPDPWPLWRQEEAIAAARTQPDRWLLECEGEKAVEIARQGGLAAISQPGHAHTPERIQPRYEALRGGGVPGVVYLADEDAPGLTRALQALQAAKAADLPLVILPASEAWLGLPLGGSIDDPQSPPVERAKRLLQRVAELEPHQWAEVWADWRKRLGVTPSVADRDGRKAQGDAESKPKTKRDLQQFLCERHTFERDELRDLPVIDGDHVLARFIPHYDQFLADRYGLDVHPRTAEGVLRYLCDRNPYNPVARYLQEVATSSETRLLGLDEIGHAFGLEADDQVSLDALARHLVGAVKRGLEPGYKHDSLLILSGGQGYGKSEAVAALSPETGWLDSESTAPKFEEWPFLIRLSSCWHFVFDECDRMLRGKHSSEVKGLVTRRHDQWARKNEAEKTNHPRRCVMWGTTNEESGILNDPTGVRRFWIAFVRHRCDPSWIARNRDSIWATAMAWSCFGGTNYYPPGHPLEQALQERAWAASFESSYAPRLHQALDGLPVGVESDGIAQDDLVRQALGIDLDRLTNRRERMDLIEEVGRAVTASSFTTHGGRWRWVKARKRYGRRNPVACFRPVPADESQAAAAAGPPDPSGFLAEPAIPVPTCAEGVPMGRHGHSPWGAVDSKTCADCVKEKEVPTRGEEGCAAAAGLDGFSSRNPKKDRHGRHSSPDPLHWNGSDRADPIGTVGTGSAQTGPPAPVASLQPDLRPPAELVPALHRAGQAAAADAPGAPDSTAPPAAPRPLEAAQELPATGSSPAQEEAPAQALPAEDKAGPLRPGAEPQALQQALRQLLTARPSAGPLSLALQLRAGGYPGVTTAQVEALLEQVRSESAPEPEPAPAWLPLLLERAATDLELSSDDLARGLRRAGFEVSEPDVFAALRNR